MRRNMTEEEKQKRIKVREFLKQNPISSPDDLNTFFKDMMKVMIEEFYQGELEEELGYTKYDYRNKESNNSRNGYSSKKLKSSAGEIEVNVPRDRNGEYEPQVVKKHQNTIGQDLEAKIISMYAKGMTTSDIESHIEEIYGYQVSDSSITRITDKILPLVKEWQTRPLEAVYPIVFMDAIHYHVRSEGQIVKKAVYIAIGISSSGEKDVIGMWVGENESAKFWLSKLNELKSRGVEDILIACVDGLTGFSNAIEAVYPQTQIQQCIIHQIRSSTQFVSYKDIKALIADLKLVYKAATEENALLNLELFDEKWGKKYPKIAISWKNNWPRLSTYFKYPQEIRTLIYTTNTIEGYNRQLRKVTKNKSVFPTDDSLLKMLYLATQDITKKWTSRQRDWGQMISQFQIYFEGRI
ncbi:IS256 family transposase [Cetobacterium somerae]|uniref:IS256 family transposase n=3 Tax=Fusobacteriaceae TaxID=203492 RepID=UPI0006464867|nr:MULTISPECIES: IS256 family transposase [Cetobacterium]MCQ9628518.1 IS256 family transposase [Cetobacterium somerae]